MQARSSRLLVGLVTDVGRVDDGTFNQFVYDGLMRAVKDYKLDYEVVETTDPDQYEKNITDLIARGCSVLVTVGSTTGTDVERIAMRTPDVHFVIVDYTPFSDSSNVIGLVFEESEAGFLAGALAGLITQSNTIGFVGGEEIPPVRKFHIGFKHGAEYTNRRVKVLDAYTGSFTDEALGIQAGGDLVEQGSDVVFAAGGQCGSAAIKFVAEAGTWVIGVDQDEYLTTFAEGAVAGADRLLSSAIKRVDMAIYTILGQIFDGGLVSGTQNFTLANDGVGLAPYHAADAAVSSEVRGKIQEVTDQMRAGRVRTRVGSMGEELVEGFFARMTTWNWQAALLPFLAIFSALVIGAIFIAAFDPNVWEAFNAGFWNGIKVSLDTIRIAYTALFHGAFGEPARISEGIRIWRQTGSPAEFQESIRPFTESLRLATPYIFTGLAVALGFRCGLFNIGAEGQYFVGGLAAVFIGYSLKGVPAIIHLPLAVIAGMVGGAAWAAIAGWLRAKTGAHEVINTIMLNYIAYRLADYLLQVGGPMARGDYRPVSPEIEPTAFLPQFFPNDPTIRINAGFILALVAVWAVYWLLFKTTLGFEIRSVGANPRAAKTAGINVSRSFVVAMALSGSLAGLAGAHDILGVIHFMPNAFSTGYGFDAIALALLGKSHPVGVLLSALLFGFLRAGAQRMQAPPAGVPIDIISIVQALIIIFIAAPEIVRLVYRIRAQKETAETVFTRGWGSS